MLWRIQCEPSPFDVGGRRRTHVTPASFPFQAAEDASVEGCVAVAAADEEKAKLIDSLVDNVTWQMGRDAKNAALKTFQGHIYREAYKTGKLLGQ